MKYILVMAIAFQVYHIGNDPTLMVPVHWSLLGCQKFVLYHCNPVPLLKTALRAILTKLRQGIRMKNSSKGGEEIPGLCDCKLISQD